MSERPDNLGSHEIGARSLIVIAPYVLHRHERLWDRPDMFDPSRFLPPARSEVPRFAYLPFGAVPHLHRIILCAAGGDDRVGGAVRRFDLDLLPGTKVWPLQGITLWPTNALPMRLRKCP